MTTMMPPELGCHRGDVVLVLFPHSDLVTAKTRPALVVQANDLESGVPQLIVAMISGRMFRAGHPSRVVIERVIGSIPMAAVDRSLRHSLGL